MQLFTWTSCAFLLRLHFWNVAFSILVLCFFFNLIPAIKLHGESWLWGFKSFVCFCKLKHYIFSLSIIIRHHNLRLVLYVNKLHSTIKYLLFSVIMCYENNKEIIIHPFRLKSGIGVPSLTINRIDYFFFIFITSPFVVIQFHIYLFLSFADTTYFAFLR